MLRMSSHSFMDATFDEILNSWNFINELFSSALLMFLLLLHCFLVELHGPPPYNKIKSQNVMLFARAIQRFC